MAPLADCPQASVAVAACRSVGLPPPLARLESQPLSSVLAPPGSRQALGQKQAVQSVPVHLVPVRLVLVQLVLVRLASVQLARLSLWEPPRMRQVLVE